MADHEISAAAASVISILADLGNTITSIQALRKEWKEAELSFIPIGAQLTALRAVLFKLKDLTDTDLVDRHHYIVMNLDVSVSCCRLLLGEVNACVAKLRKKGDEDSSEFSLRFKAVFSERSISDVQKVIRRQADALKLILEACECNSVPEQKALLEKPTAIKVFRKIQNDSESLRVHRDADSMITRCTDNLSKLSIVFPFDQELFLSSPYERWLRGSVKESLRRQQQSHTLPREIQSRNTPLNGGTRSLRRDVRSLIFGNIEEEAEQKRRSKEIDYFLEKESLRHRKECKVLILGISESGKSSIVKNMKMIYQNGYNREEREMYKPSIRRNTINCVQTLLFAMEEFNIHLGDEENREQYAFLTEFLASTDSWERLDTKVGETISSLWKDPCISKLMEHASEFYLMDCASYFLDEVGRIASPDYLPTELDIVKCRTKTTGIYETRFNAGLLNIHMFDVGGTRSERKKWIHCFENVTAIIFVVDLGCYDQVLLEDREVNRMSETITLFDSIVNSRWFPRTLIVVLLNKSDKLKQKLATSPLENYFPDYAGGDDATMATEYILGRLKQVNRAQLNIYPHIIQTTDVTNVRPVFGLIQGILEAKKASESFS